MHCSFEGKASEVEKTVREAIVEVVGREELSSDSLRAEARLAEDLGIDSLSLAVLVVKLQQRLNIDPFAQGRPTARSVREFIDLYREPPGQAE